MGEGCGQSGRGRRVSADTDTDADLGALSTEPPAFAARARVYRLAGRDRFAEALSTSGWSQEASRCVKHANGSTVAASQCNDASSRYSIASELDGFRYARRRK